MLTKQEIRQLGNREMMDELQKSRRELLKNQFDIRGGSSKEVHVVKNLRRYIARLQTIANEMKMDTTHLKADKAASPAAVEKKAAAPAPAKKTSAPKKTAPKAKAAKAPAKKTGAAKSANK